MGCDIHLYVEYKDENGRWFKCKDGFTSDYFDQNSEHFRGDKYKDSASPYEGRNYLLFGYLADVRNGEGFAGCDLGDALIPIAEPKGLPDDISMALQEDFDEFGCWDGHSCSYFTLGELREAYKNAEKITVVKRGFVSPEQYKIFKVNGEQPDMWCGWTSIEGYKQIEWKTNLAQDLAEFFDHVIPQLEKWNYGKRKDDKIRIVFWFDN